MALSSQQAVERALRQIRRDANAQSRKLSREQVTSLRSSLSVIANDALELFAKRVAESDAYEGLQKDYSTTPVAGAVDLSTQTAILFDIDRSRVRVASSNASLQAIDSMETLENGGLPNYRVYYAQDGHELRFRDTTGSITAYNTPIKIKANYIPSFTDSALPIPGQYEAAIVSTMVELATADMSPMEAQEGAAKGRS